MFAASAVMTVGALGGAIGRVRGSAFRVPVTSAPQSTHTEVSSFVQGLRDIIDVAYLPGYRLPINAVLGQWELTFHGDDANEAENVSLCAQALDGLVIPSGGVFSFNEAVGERSQQRGFRPGLMYVAGQVVTGMGGGVCIPSTAIYNAALSADMEVLERHSHSGPVSYATPGLDAAVVYGFKDLRFRNTSDAPITLHASIVGNILSVGINGKPVPGRRVVVERTGLNPLPFEETKMADATMPRGQSKVKQQGRAGWTATVVRTVYANAKVIRRETISDDTVAPRARILLVNPLDLLEAPPASNVKSNAPKSESEAPNKPEALEPKGSPGPAFDAQAPVAPDPPAPSAKELVTPSNRTRTPKPVLGGSRHTDLIPEHTPAPDRPDAAEPAAPPVGRDASRRG